MSADYWLNWSPEGKKSDTCAGIAPSKPSELTTFEGFEGAILANTPNFLDREAWREDFERWMRERCMHREGHEDWGGIGALWRDFVEWSTANNELPATQEVFIGLLTTDGWQIRNNMVCGLFLREDLWALEEH